MNNQLTNINQPQEIKLTPKNRVFLQYLSEGCSVVEAHTKAGYKGNRGSAYELYSQLKYEFAKILEAQGYSREGLASEILQLSKKPLIGGDHITINQKIRLLSLMLNALRLDNDKSKVDGPRQVTNFVINRTDGKTHVIVPENVVDTDASVDSAGQGEGKSNDVA